MNGQASFTLRGRNPDVLTCIANLSNDEVFTPPEFANRMLDTLAEAWAANHNGANLWADKKVRFLDPCTKSGVFLREITSRLTLGLARKIPNLEERVNHILTKPIRRQKLLHILQRLAVQSSPAPESEPAATPPPAAESGPPLDLPRLLEDFNGQRSPVTKLLLKFSTHLVAICAEMREALNQKNMDALRRGAHKIKGASSNYAAHALARVASQLEEAASRGNSAICDPLLGQLDFEKQRLLDFLNSPAFTSPVPPSHS